MYNYYTDIIWKIDLIFLVLSLALAAIIILNAATREYIWIMRSRALLNIKKHVYEMLLAGQDSSGDELRRLLPATTPQQFIDVTTNRQQKLTFFNDSEREIFKKCFISVKNIDQLKKIASETWNKWRRIEAIMSLGYAQAADVADILKKALLDRDEDVSYFSMIALGQIKNRESARILIDFFKKRPLQSFKMVSLLEDFPDYVADDAIQLTYDNNPIVRLWGVRLIATFKAAKHIERVEELTKDKTPDMRAAACECLGKIGVKKVSNVLEKALKDDSWLVRASAVKGLSELLGGDSVPFAVSLINDSSLSVITAVKDVLITHMKEAALHIEKFLEDGDFMAKKTALEALEESGYLVKMLASIASAGPERQAHLRSLLEGMIEGGGRFGMEEAVKALDPGPRSKILAYIEKINPAFAEYLGKNTKDEIRE